MSEVSTVSLHEAARERYLSYALSVITARALPDVRDGLKPVQRRILFTMYHELSLHPGGRYRKCAAVVGDVMGKYHPHGDQSIYDALVRMAQDFSLRATLVDPQGNFGSLDGDPPAAMRYTECKLRPLAEELLSEIDRETVDFRPTYDGQRQEPVVLPAPFPQLIVNGVEGIAVGLSTRIPPHNLGEIIAACIAMIDGDATDVEGLLRHVKGPDFPTGGRIINEPGTLKELYETGHGSVRIQATWTTEKDGRRELVVITSVPYGQNKSKLVEKIGEDVATKRLPLVVDVRDESTDVVRVVLELRPGAKPEQVMAWLYKRTGLETSFPAQFNALVPSETGGLPQPVRLDLYAMLDHWLTFRVDTVRRRYLYDLRRLEERIHILEGFAIIFADLDEVIAIIRASESKKDAAQKLMVRFHLSELQVEAILETKLYKIARMEIAAILDELTEKRAAAAEIRAILGSEARLTAQVRTELVELSAVYATPRLTLIGEAPVVLDFDETAYIVKEETFVVVSREGWIKRQGSITSVDKVRVRDGDEVGWIIQTDTGSTLSLFVSDGAVYTMRVDDVPSTTGHGKPLSAFFVVSDGATLVGVVPHDPRRHKQLLPPATPVPDDPPGPYVIAATRGGRVLRLVLDSYAEPSNRNGRMFARLETGDGVLAAHVCGGGEAALFASRNTHVLAFPTAEANLLKAAGKGVTGIKLAGSDEVVVFAVARAKGDGPEITLSTGRNFQVTLSAAAGPRAGKGRQLLKRGTTEAPPFAVSVWMDPQRTETVQPKLFEDTSGGEE